MIDPVTPGHVVPWRGKSYTLQLTLGRLCAASGALNIPIIELGPDSVFAKPEFFQRGVLLYALVSGQFPDATLNECLDAVTGEKAGAYLAILTKAFDDIRPKLNRLHGGEDKSSPPLEEKPSGEGSGQQEQSI